MKVRVAGEAKTHLGVFMGEAPVSVHLSLDKKGILDVSTYNNPAIFVPELKRIVYGMESWWGKIKSPDDLRDITDDDIGNVWYVRAMQELELRAETEKNATAQ